MLPNCWNKMNTEPLLKNCFSNPGIGIRFPDDWQHSLCLPFQCSKVFHMVHEQWLQLTIACCIATKKQHLSVLGCLIFGCKQTQIMMLPRSHTDWSVCLADRKHQSVTAQNDCWSAVYENLNSVHKRQITGENLQCTKAQVIQESKVWKLTTARIAFHFMYTSAINNDWECSSALYIV